MTTEQQTGDSVDRRRITQTLQACREEIGQRIDSARSSSEKEVIAIGECINAIVDRTRSYVADIEQQHRSHAQSEIETKLMVKEMVASVERQESSVRRAMAQSSSILKAGRDVQAMASATRLLSLNARVEASRLGIQGSSFSVIADEMRQLSHAVQQTNSSVSNMAKELQRLLPAIAEQNRSIHEQFERFYGHIEARLQNVEGDRNDGKNPVLEEIMKMAYEALSHLAFQDPMAQSLQRIHDSLDRLAVEIERPTGDDSPAPAPDQPTESGEPDLEAGEMMLF